MNYLTFHLLILRLLICLASLTIFNCGNSNLARGQDLDNVTISGLVMDQNGSFIPGASVAARLVKTGVTRTTTTDREGRYRLIQLEPGHYTVRLSATGFESQERKDLVAIAGQNVQLNVTLYLQGIIVEPVVVTAVDAPLVDTTRTVVGGTVTTDEIDSLPLVSRSPLDLIFTLPGITEEPLSTRDLAEDRDPGSSGTPEEAGIFALSGGAAYSNNITIDGLDNNDDRAARERFQPSLEAVEEVQIIANQFSAEYGRASGGRVNIRTRSGAKEFRGRSFYFFRDESLNANTFRNNTLGLQRLPLQEHNPGFALGGPIGFFGNRKRSRTFFFTAYEFDKVLDAALIDTLVPVQQALFPLPPPTTLVGRRLEDASSPALSAEIAPFISSISTPLKNSILTARVDHQFSDSHNGAFLFQLGRLNTHTGSLEVMLEESGQTGLCAILRIKQGDESDLQPAERQPG